MKKYFKSFTKTEKIEILTALFMFAVSLVGLWAGDQLLNNFYNL